MTWIGNLATVIVSPRYMGYGLMSLILWIRREVVKIMKTRVIRGGSVHHPYSACHPNLSENWTPADEVDLSAAYASVGRRLGIFTDPVYDRLMTFHKDSRMKLVGSLGTKHVEVHYDVDGKYLKTINSTEPTEPAWAAIVNETDRIMLDSISEMGDDYLYYYMDAIWVKRGRGTDMMRSFHMRGYGAKMNQVNIRRDGLDIVTSQSKTYKIRRTIRPALSLGDRIHGLQSAIHPDRVAIQA